MEEVTKEVVETTTPIENAEGESIDSILEALDTTTEEKTEETLVETKEEKKDYFKKIGNHIFKTEQEYDSWAQKNYGEVSRLSGENKRLEEKVKSGFSQETKEKTEQDVESLRMKFKAIDFFDDNPDAYAYKEEMAAFLRSGKANDEKGRPSLEIAYKKALRADGKDVVEKDDNKDNIKKIMQVGGGDSGRSYGEPYRSNDDIKAIDDFANSALSGRI